MSFHPTRPPPPLPSGDVRSSAPAGQAQSRSWIPASPARRLQNLEHTSSTHLPKLSKRYLGIRKLERHEVWEEQSQQRTSRSKSKRLPHSPTLEYSIPPLIIEGPRLSVGEMMLHVTGTKEAEPGRKIQDSDSFLDIVPAGEETSNPLEKLVRETKSLLNFTKAIDIVSPSVTPPPIIAHKHCRLRQLFKSKRSTKKTTFSQITPPPTSSHSRLHSPQISTPVQPTGQFQSPSPDHLHSLAPESPPTLQELTSRLPIEKRKGKRRCRDKVGFKSERIMNWLTEVRFEERLDEGGNRDEMSETGSDRRASPAPPMHSTFSDGQRGSEESDSRHQLSERRLVPSMIPPPTLRLPPIPVFPPVHSRSVDRCPPPALSTLPALPIFDHSPPPRNDPRDGSHETLVAPSPPRHYRPRSIITFPATPFTPNTPPVHSRHSSEFTTSSLEDDTLFFWHPHARTKRGEDDDSGRDDGERSGDGGTSPKGEEEEDDEVEIRVGAAGKYSKSSLVKTSSFRSKRSTMRSGAGFSISLYGAES